MRREKALISNELRDSAAAEVVSFILILAAVAAGIGISAAVLLPEMEKTAEITHSTELQDGIFSLKTVLDKQWLLDVPGTYGSLLLPAENTALHLKPGAEISFRHTDGNKTANLLHLSALPAYIHMENREIVLEGGAVFLENRSVLPHTAGDSNTVLLCFSGEETTLLANTPVAVSYFYLDAETYTNLSSIQVSKTPYLKYWEEELRGTENLTLLSYHLALEAVP